jgi:hypothetical protein
MYFERDLPQTNEASAGAATSAAVPSADDYDDEETKVKESEETELEVKIP